MSHVAKSNAKGIGTSSFMDLKAELSKQESEVSRNKLAGIKVPIVRPDKKPTVWARQNKGVKARASRDVEHLEAVSASTLDSARAALERKVGTYDKLRKGKTGGLSEKEREALLVDFDLKPSGDWEPDSDDFDESLTVPQRPDMDDPVVEYEDEYGRLRTARRSEVPRQYQKDEDEVQEDEIIYNPVGHLPIYEPSVERLAEIAKAAQEEDSPQDVHYDASQEVRAKGASFYNFSKDQETRRAQQEELKASREESSRARHEAGALDVKPGEIEGMQAKDGPGRSRAMEMLKRRREERRQLINAKRQKRGAPPIVDPEPKSSLLAKGAPIQAPPSPQVPPHPPQAIKSLPPIDPIATLEAQGAAHPADDFLAQIERDLQKRK